MRKLSPEQAITYLCMYIEYRNAIFTNNQITIHWDESHVKSPNGIGLVVSVINHRMLADILDIIKMCKATHFINSTGCNILWTIDFEY